MVIYAEEYLLITGPLGGKAQLAALPLAVFTDSCLLYKAYKPSWITRICYIVELIINHH